MSGGSFNYLCYVEDLHDLASRWYDLESMQKALADLGYAEEEARETKELLDSISQLETTAQASIERLKSVWKAVEWWQSCDYSEDQVKKAIVENRELRKKTS